MQRFNIYLFIMPINLFVLSFACLFYISSYHFNSYLCKSIFHFAGLVSFLRMILLSYGFGMYSESMFCKYHGSTADWVQFWADWVQFCTDSGSRIQSDYHEREFDLRIYRPPCVQCFRTS